jgi:AcrR family transcriptional regulator
MWTTYDPHVGPVKRRYDNTRRHARALATRRDVLNAAGELFTAHGYAGSSVDAIAARAGVSRDTIFKTFGGKRQLLQRWVEHRLVGADEPVPIAQQRWVDAIRVTSDAAQQIRIAAAAVTTIYDRAIDALITLRAAAHADPDIAELWRLACDQRRHDVETITGIITGIISDIGSIQHGRDETVVDVVYALTAPETFEIYVRQCGWSLEQFQAWLAAALTSALLAPSRADAPGPTDRTRHQVRIARE